MQDGNVNKLLDAWESGFPRFGRFMVNESRSYAALGFSARLINETAMNQIIAECKRDKDDIVR